MKIIRKNNKSWFIKNINKIDNFLHRLTKNKGMKALITNIRNEGADITIDSMDIK